MSEIEDPTEEKRVAYMKSRREYADALRTRSETERLNPSMIKGERAAPWKPVQEAAIAGASSRAFLTAFGNGGSETSATPKSVNPSTLIEQKSLIIRSLVAAGKRPEEIETYMVKVAPFIDVVAAAGAADPIAQSMLFTRLMSGSGSQGLTIKDVAEVIALVNSARSQQPQSDTASIIAALGSFLAATKTNNASDSIATIQNLYAEMSKNQQRSFDSHLQLLRERYTDQPSFQDQLAQIVQVQKTLGSLGKESDTIASKRMDVEFQKWQAQLNAASEDRKSKNQSAMIERITGGLSKALESPIVREAGRGIGQVLGKTSPTAGRVASAVTGAPTAAARAELNTSPTEIPWGLTCDCGAQHRFSQLQLATIEDKGGRWACPNCGKVYELQPGSGDKNGGGA